MEPRELHPTNVPQDEIESVRDWMQTYEFDHPEFEDSPLVATIPYILDALERGHTVYMYGTSD